MEELKNEAEAQKKLNFLEEIIESDLASGKYDSILTRFPPEPNGYLHLGHAKSLCINFGLAQKYHGKTNLRYDDTNPTKEDTEYVDAIKEDIKWLGFQWEKECYASDYFDQLYEWAEQMILKGQAYVDDQTQEEMRENRGTVETPGKDSPWRNRSAEENLRLFREMKAGKYADGEKVLRAKIDMAPPNMMFRDPILYRIKHAHHHRTGDKWCIYPMYDFTHGQCDSIEHITHSICTLEFDVHRPLYDWFIETLGIFPSHQYEFARLNLTYTLMSKRKLLELVQKGLVAGWDDPRMPTICGYRRRGYSPESIVKFIDKIGYTTYDALNEIALMESAVREDLNGRAIRVSAVLDPVKVVITNYPEGQTEMLTAINNPENEADGTHEVAFSREIWIERDDFMDVPEKKFMRMAPGKEVRLKNAYIVECTGCKKDENGLVTEIYCTYDPESKSGLPGADRKIKGKTLHWVSCAHALKAEVRLYDRLWKVENPRDEMAAIRDAQDCDAVTAMKQIINPDSLHVLSDCYVEEFAGTMPPLSYLQFQRIGYFNVDTESTPEHLVFNKTVGLKDTYSKANR